MNLKILLPNEVYFDGPITKVTAEATSGSFCLLPNHVDLVTALVPGLMTAESPEKNLIYFAVDEGILCKQGAEVVVSARRAVRGTQLGTLRATIEQDFRVVSEEEQRARSAVARLETALARRFIDFQRHG